MEKSPFNSDCNNAWNLQAAADDLKDDKFPNNAGNWATDSYNQCAHDFGVDPEVDKILKQCLDDDSSQCIALGETAASIIVFANVCDGSSAARHQDYLQTCREVAYGICEGAINDKIEEQCPDQLPVSTTELKLLMGMCVEQVDSMTGGGDDRIVTKQPTRKPAKKPTKNPTKKPTKKPTRKPTRKPGWKPSRRQK